MSSRCLALPALVFFLTVTWAEQARAETPQGADEGTASHGPSAAAPAGWHVDEQGRVFRVRFDPGSRWLLGWSYAPGWSEGELELGAAVIETGMLYRHVEELAAEGVAWKLYHQVLPSQVQLSPAESRLRTTLYQGRYMRWSREGSIVLPTSPPQHVPFPLNIGCEAEAGSVDYVDRAEDFGVEIGVARAEVLLDVWRQRELGSYAQLGVGPAYELWLDPLGEPASDELAVGHVIAPFTRASLAFHYETGDGHHTVHSQVAGGYAVTSWWGGSAQLRASASYEAILLAVNDLPVSAVSSVHYRYEQAPRPAAEHHELRATLGLRLSVPLDGHAADLDILP